MENKKNLRNIVLNMLSATLEQGQLSHLVINDTFADEQLTAQDRAFINRVYSGTLEKLVYLDYVIEQFSSVKLKKMKPLVRNILRMSLYQMKFMDSVPDYTCIDEAVRLTRKRGLTNLTGFVNGILRNIQRESDKLELPDYVKACAPKWLYNLVRDQYGADVAGRFFDAVQQTGSETIIRFNLIKDTPEHIIRLLEDDGCRVRHIEGTQSAYAISGFEKLTGLAAFKHGLIIMQDISSMMAVELASDGSIKNELTIDVCAAPGGKSLYMAEKYPEARIISRDLTEYKVGLIKENIKRLGIKNIETQVYDATVQDRSMTGKADIVIADLPCSGLGVIRRKPDIMYRLKPEDLTELMLLQRKILETVKHYVKPGGILMFSTCTINKQENEENTRWFLDNNPDFELEIERQLIPGADDCDGFYAARMKKIK